MTDSDSRPSARRSSMTLRSSGHARPSNGRGARGSGRRARRRRAWIWTGVIGFTLLVGLGVGGAIGGAQISEQARQARSHLVAAMPQVAEAKSALLHSDPEQAKLAARAFGIEARKAQAATSGWLWEFAESIPLPPFENLRAVGTVSDVAVDLADDVLTPAADIDLRALVPSGGRVDLAAVDSLDRVVRGVVDSVEFAKQRVDGLDRDALLSEVGTGVDQLDAALSELLELARPVQDTVAILPSALGADGPRSYLLVFEGNAEVRAGGGGPGSFLLLRVEDGAVSIVREVASTEFDIDLPAPVIPLDGEAEALYSNIIGRWVANLSSTPDFPTTAALARGWWATRFDDRIDGVVSVDPVALSYLLTATGPLMLPSGETLSADTAVPLLLNEAYFRYPDGVQSNLFFASASSAVFDAFTGGAFEPVPMVQALVRATEEGRLHIWSADQQHTAVLNGSPLSGTLPETNQAETAIGVYFNDTTGSKMDYYVDASIAVAAEGCTPASSAQWTADVTLTSSISRDAAAELPRYITGPYFTPGDIATDFIVYAPVGATIESWTVNGEERPAIAHTTHLGRDAIRINIVLPPLGAATLAVKMTGPAGVGPVAVHHTPMVRDVPVTIDTPCG